MEDEDAISKIIIKNLPIFLDNDEVFHATFGPTIGVDAWWSIVKSPKSHLGGIPLDTDVIIGKYGLPHLVLNALANTTTWQIFDENKSKDEVMRRYRERRHLIEKRQRLGCSVCSTSTNLTRCEKCNGVYCGTKCQSITHK